MRSGQGDQVGGRIGLLGGDLFDGVLSAMRRNRLGSA